MPKDIGLIHHDDRFCAPNRTLRPRGNSVRQDSCLDRRHVRMIYDRYRKVHGIPASEDLSDGDEAKMYKVLKARLSGMAPCDREYCWLNLGFLSDIHDQLKDVWRPAKPVSWRKNPVSWLSNFDIEGVLKQYVDLFDDYMHIGTVPADFWVNEKGRCVVDDVCNLTIPYIVKKNKRRFGIVVNLDLHDSPGSHWVAVYANLDKRHKNFGLYYYDSVANPPKQVLARFLDLTCKAAEEHLKCPFHLHVNSHRVQYRNTECGMFATVFLLRCLEEKQSFRHICKTMGNDARMAKLRDSFFHTV
jgi:hypothetical protein